MARTRFKGSAKFFGLIIPSIRNPYFTELAARMDELATEQGYRLFLSNVGYDITRERMALQMLESMNADGAILVPGCREDRSSLEQFSIPLVVVDSDCDGPADSYIYCDFTKARRWPWRI